MTSMCVVPEASDQPDPPGAAELERIAVDTARSAAVLVAAGYGRAQRVRDKSSPTDVVTQTDLDAEARAECELSQSPQRVEAV